MCIFQCLGGGVQNYDFSSITELLLWLSAVSMTVVFITTDIFNRDTFFFNLVQNTD